MMSSRAETRARRQCLAELVRTADEACERTVADRMSVYDRVCAIFQAEAEAEAVAAASTEDGRSDPAGSGTLPSMVTSISSSVASSSTSSGLPTPSHYGGAGTGSQSHDERYGSGSPPSHSSKPYPLTIPGSANSLSSTYTTGSGSAGSVVLSISPLTPLTPISPEEQQARAKHSSGGNTNPVDNSSRAKAAAVVAAATAAAEEASSRPDLVASPTTLAAWNHYPWTRAQSDENDSALRSLIDQPITAELVCYLAVRTENVLKKPGPTRQREGAAGTGSSSSGTATDGSVSPVTGPASWTWPPLRLFISNLLSQADVRTGTAITTLVYLDRFRQILGQDVCGIVGVASHHRIFLACLILASKYVLDSTLKNNCWAKCSSMADWVVGLDRKGDVVTFGFDTSDVTQMEREMIARLQWRLGVSNEDLYSKADYFLAPIRLKQALARPPAMAITGNTLLLPNPGAIAVVGITDNRAGNTTYTPAAGAGTASEAATPVAPSSRFSRLTTPLSLTTGRRRSRLRLNLSSRKSFAALSSSSMTAAAASRTNASVAPLSGSASSGNLRSHYTQPSIPLGQSGTRLQNVHESAGPVGPGPDEGMLHPTYQNPQHHPLPALPHHNPHHHHPYATYSRAHHRSRPAHAHTHSHSSGSTISSGSGLSGTSGTVPIYEHPHFFPGSGSNQSSNLRPGSADSRSPVRPLTSTGVGAHHQQQQYLHVRHPSHGHDQALFDVEAATAAVDPYVFVKHGDGVGLDRPRTMMGMPSVVPMPTAAAAVGGPVKQSRATSFWSRIFPGRS